MHHATETIQAPADGYCSNKAKLSKKECWSRVDNRLVHFAGISRGCGHKVPPCANWSCDRVVAALCKRVAAFYVREAALFRVV